MKKFHLSTRSTAYSLIAIALLVGAIAAYAGPQRHAHKPQDPQQIAQQRAQHQLDEMSTKLNLTDDQKKQLLPALVEYQTTMLAANTKLQQTFATVLTDQQKALLKQGHNKQGTPPAPQNHR